MTSWWWVILVTHKKWNFEPTSNDSWNGKNLKMMTSEKNRCFKILRLFFKNSGMATVSLTWSTSPAISSSKRFILHLEIVLEIVSVCGSPFSLYWLDFLDYLLKLSTLLKLIYSLFAIILIQGWNYTADPRISGSKNKCSAADSISFKDGFNLSELSIMVDSIESDLCKSFGHLCPWKERKRAEQ